MKDILDKLKVKAKPVLEKIKPFLQTNKRYLAAAGVFVCFVIVLVFFTGSEFNAERIAKKNSIEVSGADYVPDAAFEIDAYPAINELVESYFNAYVNADFEKLDMIAKPVSDMEKSYITTMSAFYEEYRNITCYTKHGLSKDSYIVSACFDIKFSGQEVTAPSMVLFYVQTAEDGTLYINNLYSDFNMMYAEQPLDKDVFTALRKYTTQEDYLALYSEVETNFNQLIRDDNNMYQITKRFLPAFRQAWEDSVYYVEQSTDVTESTEEAQPTEENAVTEESQQVESEEPAPSETTVESTTPEPVIEKVKVVGINGNVNIREKADSSSSDIGDAYLGDIFVKLGVENDASGEAWVKVQFDGDKIGYIKASFTEAVTE